MYTATFNGIHCLAGLPVKTVHSYRENTGWIAEHSFSVDALERFAVKMVLCIVCHLPMSTEWVWRGYVYVASTSGLTMVCWFVCKNCLSANFFHSLNAAWNANTSSSVQVILTCFFSWVCSLRLQLCALGYNSACVCCRCI